MDEELERYCRVDWCARSISFGQCLLMEEIIRDGRCLILRLSEARSRCIEERDRRREMLAASGEKR
jgi:hypothetical protein